VTVLFCDVTGSTALGELLDPESFRQVMRRYFDTARQVIENHGGTVEKFIGDAVMAVFGVPVLSTTACELAEALYALGRYDEAWQWASRGLELGSSGDLATQVGGLGMQARLLARQGKASAALALAEQADRIARASQDPRYPGDSALYLAEIMYLSGDRTRAEQMTQRAIDLYESKGAPAFAARARRLTAQWASGASPASR
jgi:class 3 adenylate cyclase